MCSQAMGGQGRCRNDDTDDQDACSQIPRRHHKVLNKNYIILVRLVDSKYEKRPHPSPLPSPLTLPCGGNAATASSARQPTPRSLII